jgi:hypothetical protein
VANAHFFCSSQSWRGSADHPGCANKRQRTHTEGKFFQHEIIPSLVSPTALTVSIVAAIVNTAAITSVAKRSL